MRTRRHACIRLAQAPEQVRLSVMSKFRLALVLVSGMLSGAGTEGWLKIGQKTYSLRYAYAVPSPNALPSEKANGTWDIYVVVTDTAIPAKTLGIRSGTRIQSRTGRFTG